MFVLLTIFVHLMNTVTLGFYLIFYIYFSTTVCFFSFYVCKMLNNEGIFYRIIPVYRKGTSVRNYLKEKFGVFLIIYILTSTLQHRSMLQLSHASSKPKN